MVQLLFPLRGHYVPYLQLSSHRDADFYTAQSFRPKRSCGELTNRTFEALVVIRTNVDYVLNVFFAQMLSAKESSYSCNPSDLISKTLVTELLFLPTTDIKQHCFLLPPVRRTPHIMIFWVKG